MNFGVGSWRKRSGRGASADGKKQKWPGENLPILADGECRALYSHDNLHAATEMIRRRYFHLTTPIGYTVFSCGSWAHALSATMIYLLRLVQRLANYWMPDPATASLFIASSSSSLELGHGASKTTTSLSLYTIYIYIYIYVYILYVYVVFFFFFFFFSSFFSPTTAAAAATLSIHWLRTGRGFASFILRCFDGAQIRLLSPFFLVCFFPSSTFICFSQSATTRRSWGLSSIVIDWSFPESDTTKSLNRMKESNI